LRGLGLCCCVAAPAVTDAAPGGECECRLLCVAACCRCAVVLLRIQVHFESCGTCRTCVPSHLTQFVFPLHLWPLCVQATRHMGFTPLQVGSGLLQAGFGCVQVAGCARASQYRQAQLASGRRGRCWLLGCLTRLPLSAHRPFLLRLSLLHCSCSTAWASSRCCSSSAYERLVFDQPAPFPWPSAAAATLHEHAVGARLPLHLPARGRHRLERHVRTLGLHRVAGAHRAQLGRLPGQRHVHAGGWGWWQQVL